MKLKLKVNEEKSKVAKSDKVKFLGMTIVNGLIAISKITFNKAMEKVKLLIPRRSHLCTATMTMAPRRHSDGTLHHLQATKLMAPTSPTDVNQLGT